MMIPYSKMTREEIELTFLEIGDEKSLAELRDKVYRDLVVSMVDGEEGSDLSDFECSYDDGRLYELQFMCGGLAFYATFVEPKGVKKFLEENEKYTNEIGFDPLSPGDMEVETQVYVYSPNVFPLKEIASLLTKDAEIVLATSKKIYSMFGKGS